ncbi:MAG: DNA-processing protein DprA [Acidobacteriota bacterium]
MRRDIEDWIALTLVPGIGPRTVRTLLEHYGTPTAVFPAHRTELESIGLKREAVESLQTGEIRREAAIQLQRLAALGARAIALPDAEYPKLLKEIHDPPAVLYTLGECYQACLAPAIAVVGSRRCSTYGRNAVNMIVSELAAHGITIISGLARGIDTAAHQAALAAQGRTVAVLGSGLDKIYPQENGALAEEICRTGVMLSELPLGTPPLPQHFPFRNRIISGLCLGVLVVEAAERSGSLITARLAMEQNREVFAVPGNISSANSFGPNYLIKDGAKLVQNWRDVVEELPHEVRAQVLGESISQESPGQGELFLLSEIEEKIYDLLDVDEPCHVDELAGRSGLGPPQLLGALLALEVKDKIRQLPGKNFVKKS